jgi:hypothetical protein
MFRRRNPAPLDGYIVGPVAKMYVFPDGRKGNGRQRNRRERRNVRRQLRKAALAVWIT